MNASITFPPSSRSFAAAALLLVMIVGGASTPVSAFSARALPMLVHHRAAAQNNNNIFESTTALPPHHFHNSISPISTTSNPATRKKSTICLRMNFSPPDNKDIGGLNEGKYLLLLVLSACIWIFSIPPEYRRARFCTDEDVRLYPEKHCTTFNAWRTGIAEYYANGGGVHFDFSIEGK